MFKDISDVIDKGFNAVVLNGKLYEIQGGFKDSLLVGPPNEDVSFEIRLSEVRYFTIMDKSRQSVFRMMQRGSILKLGSLFDGIGGFPLVASRYKIKPVWASEIEPFPIKVTQKHFPNMKHLGDITQVNGAEIEPVDIITFGSPCFPAGTLILTETGYTPIENVKIGDKVFTHKGNWKRVTDVGWKYSNTIILKGSHYGLELTPNHPIWSAETKKYYPTYSNGKRGNKRKLINVGEWTRADNMKGKRWAIPNSITGIKIPDITLYSNKANDAPKLNEDTFYFIGRWLGDGWLSDRQRPNRPDGQTWGQIFLCCSHNEANEVQKIVNAVFPVASRINEQNVVKFRISNISFAKWLKDNFGEHADQKTIPAWAYCMDDKLKHALLNGYMDADGWKVRNGFNRATTVSVKLAHGIRLLAETLGYSTAVYKCEMPPSTTIEGRNVSQKTMYQIDVNSNKKTNAISTDTHNWYPVKKISPGREKVKVFNITVDDDCSYIAEGFVVHNCQDLSVAGKREGLQGERSGLFMDAVRIIREMRTATRGQCPRFAVWENVPGAFSSNKGEDFRAVLEEIAETEIPMPRSGKWATAGMVRTERVDIAWRVLDAQYWGVPQRRKRIFLVADFRGQCAGEILFVEEGLSGDSAESGEAREEAAATVGDGVEKSSYWDGGQISDCLTACGLSKQHMEPDKDRFHAVVLADHDVCRVYEDGIVPTLNTAPRDVRASVKESSDIIFDPYNNNLSEKCTSLGTNCGMSTGRSIVLRETTGTLRANAGAPKHESDWESLVLEKTDLIIEPRSQDGVCRIHHDGIVPTLNTAQGGQRQPCVITSQPIPIHDKATRYKGGGPTRKNDGAANGFGVDKPGDVMPTLGTGDRHAVAYTPSSYGAYKEGCGTLRANGGDLGGGSESLVASYTVRRLTPTECLRLQGFPDWWLDIEGMSDSAKYRAIGNSVAIPCVEYVLGGIVEALSCKKEG